MNRSMSIIAVLALWLSSAVSSNQELVTKQADDNQWALPGKNYAAPRYSTLRQLTALLLRFCMQSLRLT